MGVHSLENFAINMSEKHGWKTHAWVLKTWWKVWVKQKYASKLCKKYGWKKYGWNKVWVKTL